MPLLVTGDWTSPGTTKRELFPWRPTLRVAFWVLGSFLATRQAWIRRYEVSADSISYLDMSDAVMAGGHWHRLINGVWSPLYPLLLGLFRRLLHISAQEEIAAGHLFNLAFFLFALVSFEQLVSAVARIVDAPERQLSRPLPAWMYWSIAYALFLWGAISQVSLGRLRPDMLMSGFLYLALATLCRMRGAPARWRLYLALGVILGFGYLAKAPMLPIGILILTASLVTVENWRPALKMALASGALMLAVGSLYFLPLSLERKRFTLGESSTFNYAVHVNEVAPSWYLQNLGSAGGAFLRTPEKIFFEPPAYWFAIPLAVTHPLRFDPSYWIEGVRPHFAFRTQWRAIVRNSFVLTKSLRALAVVGLAVLVLAFLAGGTTSIAVSVTKVWPIWLIGLAGCAMYVLISVEPRYVGPFLVLLGFGLLAGFPLPRWQGRKIALLITLALVVTTLHSAWRQASTSAGGSQSNEDFEAAQQLERLGLGPGGRVARISSTVNDTGVERILRVEIAGEVENTSASEFWASPRPNQQDLLRAFSARGAEAVIATNPRLRGDNRLDWQHLGTTRYWVWRP